MKLIRLGESGIEVPRIGFGCAAILGRTGRKDSLNALNAAWDEGIRFFDTARSYGYGESETLLGEFFQGRRDQAVIATKFGILPAPQNPLKNAAKAVVRNVLTVAPSLRKLAQKGVAGQFSANQFTLPVLTQSIEVSLRKLRTDYVDLLFLHQAPASVLEQEDLLQAMGRLVESGKVRIAGISSDPDVIQLALSKPHPPLNAMQFPANVFNISEIAQLRRPSNHATIMIANHPFGGAARVHQCRSFLSQWVKQNQLPPSLRQKLENLDEQVFADIVLNVILNANCVDVVIPAMMTLKHIQANIHAVEQSRFTVEEITLIREALGR